MTSRQQLPRRRCRKERAEADHDRLPDRTPAQARTGEIDDLLDEIDAVLEEQEVLANFRQRSGQ